MVKPPHIGWLKDTGERRHSACGREIQIWEIDAANDAAALSAWAAHFRHHYCADVDLPALVAGTGKSKSDFLKTILFPDEKIAPGPSLRSGDFGEILVADFIEYVLGYWCPRELRYQDRWNRQDSTKGCDIVGIRFFLEQGDHAHDELFVFESKSGMSPTDKNRLQDAVTDSMKDHLREAMTLNAMKQRLLVRGRSGSSRLGPEISERDGKTLQADQRRGGRLGRRCFRNDQIRRHRFHGAQECRQPPNAGDLPLRISSRMD